jgi:hypothetical protein
MLLGTEFNGPLLSALSKKPELMLKILWGHLKS